ncbi:unnamed protein product [Mucor hiemalis]
MTGKENEILAKNEALSKQLQKLLKAQDTRMELYNEFDIAFKNYLSGKCPAEQYHSICKIITDKVIAGMIRALQQGEKEKLEKTCKIQILTIQAKESDKDFDETIKELKDSLKTINEKTTEVWDELREEMHSVASLIC